MAVACSSPDMFSVSTGSTLGGGPDTSVAVSPQGQATNRRASRRRTASEMNGGVATRDVFQHRRIAQVASDTNLIFPWKVKQLEDQVEADREVIAQLCSVVVKL